MDDEDLKLMEASPHQYDFPNSYYLSRLSTAATRDRELVEALEPLRKAFHLTRLSSDVPINATDLARVLDLAFPLTNEPTR